MKKRHRILVICMLSASVLLACSTLTAVQPTATPPPPATPEPTVTRKPTPTSEPTPVSEPAPAEIPGWERFVGRGVELWLPESFEGGNLDTDIDVIVERLRNLGPDFEKIAQMIEQNPNLYVLWALDSEVSDSGILTNVSITTEKVLSAMTLDTYLDAVESHIPAQFQLVERDIVPLGEREAGRLVLEFEITGVTGKELMYVIKEGNRVWAITYATGADEYEQRLPDFEQSALTFAVQP